MSENVNIDTSLGDFVARYPKTRKVFEKYSIDYCCGGTRKIKEAIEESNLDLNDFFIDLDTILNETSIQEKEEEKVWVDEPFADIANHIESKHHAFLRQELPYIEELMSKILKVHGEKHGDFLFELDKVFKVLKEDLTKHLDDEEANLFPFVKTLDSITKEEIISIDKNKFEEIIGLLSNEHDDAGAALSKMRELTSNYILPQDACVSFATLYEHLEALEDDLHKHVHLENSVLFPRVLALINQ
jgi:regulator of cell morphogenesis and NO signaling